MLPAIIISSTSLCTRQ